MENTETFNKRAREAFGLVGVVRSFIETEDKYKDNDFVKGVNYSTFVDMAKKILANYDAVKESA